MPRLIAIRFIQNNPVRDSFPRQSIACNGREMGVQTQAIASGVRATPTNALLGLMKKASCLMGRSTRYIIDHPGSDEQNVAPFESNTLLAGGLFEI